MIFIALLLKCLCLYLAIFFSLVNIMRAFAGNNIPRINFILQSIGITGFIILQWMIK
jgi:hypothetical protein